MFFIMKKVFLLFIVSGFLTVQGFAQDNTPVVALSAEKQAKVEQLKQKEAKAIEKENNNAQKKAEKAIKDAQKKGQKDAEKVRMDSEKKIAKIKEKTAIEISKVHAGN